MVKTKQTKRGGSSTRPVGITPARFEWPEADQFENTEEEEANWPDMEHSQGTQTARATEGKAS